MRQIGSKISSAEPAKEGSDQYVVYANINSSDEDFSFLVTALYHWETMYPTFTLDLPKDPAELAVKSPEKKPEDKKEEVPAEVSKPSQVESLIQSQMMAAAADMDQSQLDMQELISLQRQQVMQN